jgi:DNA polymerase-3 subunit gamma/tau
MTTIACAKKYEPTSIQEVVFNVANTEHFMLAYASGEMRCPHLMLHGTNGSGKTTVANLIAKALTRDSGLWLRDSADEFLKRNNLRYYLDCNLFAYGQADDRAVIVFNELEQYSRSLSKLWTAMDENADKLVVIITTNEPTKFQNAILSRCDMYEFKRITPGQYAPRAQQILAKEGLILSVREVEAYLEKYTGAHSDVRDYLRTMDKMLSLDRVGKLPAINQDAASRPTLTVVS